MDRKSIMIKRMNEELVFESLEEALKDAIRRHKEGMQLSIVKSAVGQFVTVKSVNWEIADLLGYDTVITYSELTHIVYDSKDVADYCIKDE